MSLNFYLAEVNMQSKVIIYFFLAGTSISNAMPNFQMSKTEGMKPSHNVRKNPTYTEVRPDEQHRQREALLVMLLSATNRPALCTRCLQIKVAQTFVCWQQVSYRTYFLMLFQHFPFYSQLSTAMRLGEQQWDINITIILFFKSGF